MKKIGVLLVAIFLFSVASVNAEAYCTPSSAQQLAKILYKEVGAPLTSNKEEDYFAKLVTASIIVNNASTKSGSNFYKQIYNLTDNNYQGYSSYKDSSFDRVVTSNQQMMLYIAELVLSGRFSVPKEMHLQASQSIVNTYGTVWDHINVTPGMGIDVYFGYDRPISNTDIYGNKLSSTDPSYYRSLATSLLSDPSVYSSYTTTNVCSAEHLKNAPVINTKPGKSSSSTNTNTNNSYSAPSKNKSTKKSESSDSKNININQKNNYKSVNFCEDPNFLQALYIVLIVVDIIKILVPVVLVLIAFISLMKALLSEDDKDIKPAVKNIIQKIIIGSLIFFIPTIITATMKRVSSFNEGKFNTCINNATKQKISQFRKKTLE